MKFLKLVTSMILMILMLILAVYADSEPRIVNQNITVIVNPTTDLVTIKTEDGSRSFELPDCNSTSTTEYQYQSSFIRSFVFEKADMNYQLVNLTTAVLEQNNKMAFFQTDWISNAKALSDCNAQKATVTNDFNTCTSSCIKQETLDKEKELGVGLRSTVTTLQNELDLCKKDATTKDPGMNLAIAFIAGVAAFWAWNKYNFARTSLG